MTRSIWASALIISILTKHICSSESFFSYEIQIGDTLSGIAQRFGVTQAKLIESNSLKNNKIYKGQILEIPFTSDTYIVRPGDTLSHLAIRFNTTVAKLSAINSLKKQGIKIGQKLHIPTKDKALKKSGLKEYIVQKNDTVSEIAIQHNLRIEDLNNWNSISNDEVIIPGQTLLLAPPNKNLKISKTLNKQAQYYLVKKGDNLYKIARDFDISLDLLLRINKLTDRTIKPGQKLLIEPTNLHDGVHVVRSGETLSEIAAFYQINLSDLRELNDLRGDRILIGQKLRLRRVSDDVHLVERGDALWEIARAYGVSVNLLRKINNLNSDKIYPGQELRLITDTERHAIYVVQSGDYLGEIARLHQMSLSELRRLNQLSSSIIHPGEKLKVRPLRWLELSQIDWNSLQINHPRIHKSNNGPYYGKRPNADRQKSTKYYERHPNSPYATYKTAKKLWDDFQKQINSLGSLSSTLKGWHIVLDPGHGGLDPGAIAKTTDGNNTTLFVTEDEYVHDIALRVCVLLQLHGANVTMTLLSPNHLIRGNDPPTSTFVNEKNEVYNSLNHNKNNSLKDWPRGGNLSTRVQIARKAFKGSTKGKRIFISFHADIDHNAPEAPLVLYYESRSGKRIDHNSKHFAEGLLNSFGAGARARGQGLGVLRNNPADVKILLELRNMAYRDHVWALRFEQLRQRDAEKVVQGLLNYVKKDH